MQVGRCADLEVGRFAGVRVCRCMFTCMLGQADRLTCCSFLLLQRSEIRAAWQMEVQVHGAGASTWQMEVR